MAPNQQINQSGFSQTSHQTDKVSKKEILYDGVLYDVTKFLHRHPGGDKIILYFTGEGEDATIAIQQFHKPALDKVLKLMKTFPSRPEPVYERSNEMKQLRAKHAEMTADYLKLHEELKEEGMFESSITHWICRFLEMIALRLLGYAIIMETTGFWGQFFGSLVYTAGWSRGLWMLHDFGHLSGVGNPKWDRFFSALLCGAGVGWSGKWWRIHHNKHHAMTNRLINDPDVDVFPKGLVMNLKILKDTKKDHNIIHRYQAYFVPISIWALHFQWVFWKAPVGVIRSRSVLELFSLICYWILMYQIGFKMWLVTSFYFAIIFYGNSAVSHLFLPVTDEPLHWIEYTFLGTTDVEQGAFRWVEWWMGYLNVQIEHHLFPTMPLFRCPLIKDRVKALAEKHGLPYHICSYKDSMIKTFVNMESISQLLKSID